jgi:hypothetical protein
MKFFFFILKVTDIGVGLEFDPDPDQLVTGAELGPDPSKNVSDPQNWLF